MTYEECEQLAKKIVSGSKFNVEIEYWADADDMPGDVEYYCFLFLYKNKDGVAQLEGTPDINVIYVA